MRGAGNAFMVVDARNRKLPLKTLARKLCALKGADGFMALDTEADGGLRLHFYNADGSRAAMCGNGARCICRFAWELGLTGEEVCIATDAGPVRGRRLSERDYRVQIPGPGPVAAGAEGALVTVGVPHMAVAVPGLTWDMAESLLPRAQRLRRRDVNVDFYAPLGKNRLRVLTYERGVEAYTLACGTGCAAVAAVYLQGSDGTVTAENRGGELTVELTQGQCYLTGPAEVAEVLEVSG